MPKTKLSGPIISDTFHGLEEALDFGQRRTYPANHTLLHPGETTEFLYYIIEGEILISNYTSPESISHMFLLREKSMLGLISMFNPNKSMASWRTLCPCVCYLFSRADIYSRAPREMLLNMLEQIAAMSSSMTRRFAQGSAKRLDVRMARLFLNLIDACESVKKPRPPSITKTIAPRLTQEMASDLLGMHPVTLNRILGAFRAEGIIGRFTKNRLEVLDLPRLEQYANGELPMLDY